MPADFPYMTSAKSLKPILVKIKGAGTPTRFTLDFLKSLGYMSSTDRPVIGVLKGLGFLTNDGSPTDRYNAFRDAARSGAAMAAGLREGWSPIFLADQKANERTASQLTEVSRASQGRARPLQRRWRRPSSRCARSLIGTPAQRLLHWTQSWTRQRRHHPKVTHRPSIQPVSHCTTMYTFTYRLHRTSLSTRRSSGL